MFSILAAAAIGLAACTGTAPPQPSDPPASSPASATPLGSTDPMPTPSTADDAAPVAAVDAAIAALGVDVATPPQLDWAPRCGPAGHVLGWRVELRVPAPESWPPTWQPMDNGAWRTEQGARVRQVGDEAVIRVATTRDVIDSSDRIAPEPLRLCR